MALLKLPDGRQIHYECSAQPDPAATVLVFHHGQPGAALISDDLADAAGAQGWPVVMLSRPGYAASTRQARRTVASAASDVAAVLDHLGVGRFVTAGWSGGGPHALACGALLAPRCAAVATIAGVAPFAGVTDLDWTAGMGPENVAEFEAVIARDPDAEGRVQGFVSVLSTLQADGLVEALGGLISPPDRAVLEGDRAFAEFAAASWRLSASSGHHGYWDDGQVFTCPWGFSLDTIEIPVAVWRADLDLMVPPSHGEWLAAHLPNATGVLCEGEGHLSLLRNRIADIVSDLAGSAAA